MKTENLIIGGVGIAALYYLMTRKGTATPIKYKCSGAPNYQCSESDDGTYDTLINCESACKDPNIKHVYAKDGNTDTYIQDAIDSTYAGRKIYCHDEFDIGYPLVIPSDTTLIIDGKLKATIELGRNPIIKNSNPNNGNSNITISGTSRAEIDGNKINRSICTGSDTNTCFGILMKANAGAKNQNINIDNIYMHDHPQKAIQYINCFKSNISNSTFRYNGWTCADVYLNNGIDSWAPCYDTVSGCLFEDNKIAISPGFSRDITVKNNIIKRCTNYGIYCDGSSTTYIQYNTLNQCNPAAIGAGCAVGSPVHKLQITNNTISNSNKGIEIYCGCLGAHNITNNNGSGVTTGIEISSGNMRNGTIIENNPGLTLKQIYDPYEPYCK